MRPLVIAILAFCGGPALGHPHPGGIVVRQDGTVLVGDILRSRVVAIEPHGRLRAIQGVGHVRELEQAADSTVYGVSQGTGLWKLGPGERAFPVLSDFHGLFTRFDDGSLALAPADSLDRRPQLVTRAPDGRHSTLAALGQIEALARENRAVLVVDRAVIRRVHPDGRVETVVEGIGRGLYGLAVGPRGPVVAAFEDRQVLEVGRDGRQRQLLQSEPPWGPTDVALHNGALYVLELARHPCCWKGPRVRRLAAGSAPEVLLSIDDGKHLHLSPAERPGHWLAGGVGVLALLIAWVIRKVVWGPRTGRPGPRRGKAAQ